MPIPERTGIHCSLCNGPILRHCEWGASWYECESCGGQKSIARVQAHLAAGRKLPRASQPPSSTPLPGPAAKGLALGVTPVAAPAPPPGGRCKGRESRPPEARMIAARGSNAPRRRFDRSENSAFQKTRGDIPTPVTSRRRVGADR
jgi:hypothetical protein